MIVVGTPNETPPPGDAEAESKGPVCARCGDRLGELRREPHCPSCLALLPPVVSWRARGKRLAVLVGVVAVSAIFAEMVLFKKMGSCLIASTSDQVASGLMMPLFGPLLVVAKLRWIGAVWFVLWAAWLHRALCGFGGPAKRAWIVTWLLWGIFPSFAIHVFS